jgi:excisionase family DNA binding protein
MHRSALQTEQPIAGSIPKAVEWSGVCRSSIYLALKRGDLASVKIGRRRLILMDDLKAWLDAHRVVGGA